MDGVDAPPTAATSSTARQRLAHVLAVWFGCGHVPIAPGTAGTVGAIPLYLLLRPHGPLAVFGAAVIVTIVGIWASGIVERRLGTKDPQIVCIDEVAGVLLTWVAAPSTWRGLLVGFVLFRLFDQWKPWPARRAERLGGGAGVMLDDVVAGAWGAAVLLGVRRLGWL
ncbi:MAG TPA: phosphatidylglycerophosphatase A [Polyangia bacterium]|nr:phosphatidylglycerophosphatase A [Polyangia bacterium]